jgi:hypothetical protein
MFCDGVQHRLQFCLNHLICVKMATFKFYLPEKQRKVGLVGDDSRVVLGQKFPDEKRSSTRCFVRGKVFARFCAVTVKRHRSIWNLLFGLPGQILCGQSPLMSKKMISMLLTLLPTCLAFFGLL